MAMLKAGVRDIVDVTLFDTATGKPVMFLNSLKTSSTEVVAETVYAKGGRGNPQRIAWDASKEITFSAQDCEISPEELAILSGSSVVKGSASNYQTFTEVITLNTSSPTHVLKATPVGTTSYRTQIFKTINSNGQDIDSTGEITFNATPGSGQYKVTNATLTFGGDYTATPAVAIVTYFSQHTSGTKRITVDADEFPATFKLTGTTFWRDEATGKDYTCNIIIPKAKLLTPFTITQAADGDPSVFDMKFQVLKPYGSQQMIIYDVETEIYN